MKRKRIVKTVTCMLLMVILILSNFSIITYAKEGKVLTKEYMESKYDTSKIETAYITDAVVEIEDGTFSNFCSLKEIIVESNDYYASYKGCLYNKDYTVLICVPTKLYDIRIKGTVTSCMSHAFDGHPQYVIDQFIDLFGIVPGECNSYMNTIPSDNTQPEMAYQEKENTTEQETTTEAPKEEPKKQETPKQEPKKETTNKKDTSTSTTTTKKTEDNSDMSKYVYTDSYGRKCFKYTGSGVSNIVIPDGVECIMGFSSSSSKLNYEITSITIPQSVYCWAYYKYYKNEGDNTYYFVCYQCPNLNKVSFSDGADHLYECGMWVKENGTRLQIGDKSGVLPTDIEYPIWSSTERIPYQKSSK